MTRVPLQFDSFSPFSSGLTTWLGINLFMFLFGLSTFWTDIYCTLLREFKVVATAWAKNITFHHIVSPKGRIEIVLGVKAEKKGTWYNAKDDSVKEGLDFLETQRSTINVQLLLLCTAGWDLLYGQIWQQDYNTWLLDLPHTHTPCIVWYTHCPFIQYTCNSIWMKSLTVLGISQILCGMWTDICGLFSHWHKCIETDAKTPWSMALALQHHWSKMRPHLFHGHHM